MKTYSDSYASFEGAPSKEPRYVVQLSWDTEDTDHTYLTSSSDAAVPAGADVINDTVLKISGQTQKINPDIATSTIGSVTIDVSDVTGVYGNLAIYSEDFSGASWLTAGSVTVSTDSVNAPNGEQTADTLTSVGLGSSDVKYQDTSISIGTQVCYGSVFLKEGTAVDSRIIMQCRGVTLTISEILDIDWTTTPPTLSGDTENFDLINDSDGWYKIVCRIVNNGNDTVRFLIYPSRTLVPGYTYAWGHQVLEHDWKSSLPVYAQTVASAIPQYNDSSVTEKINYKLTAGDGLRGKAIRVYVGYAGLPFTDYDLRLTYIIDSVSYKDSIYKFKTSDVQRIQKHKIFTPNETTLNTSLNETDLIIPVTSIDTDLFPSVTHGPEWTVRPSETVAYIKLDDEVIAHTGGIAFDATHGWFIQAIERGALNTRKAIHDVGSDVEDNRKPKITEHIYIEGAAPKIIYALLTGILLNGNSPEDTLPEHWHLGIDTTFVRLADFQSIGVDMWNPADGTGRPVRIENPGTQQGKRYIEKEMLLWMGCFMPIYSTGELGLRKLSVILSDSSYKATLDKYNISGYSDLTHDMRQVINDIRVDWNWIDGSETFTKTNLFIDSLSIDAHGTADQKSFAFKTVHTGIHTDESLLSYFDVLRDRYSGPPVILTLNLMPTMSRLEVGDTVRVQLDQIRDYNSNTTLDRTFEIQQVATDWTTGAIKVKLFGSSQAAGAIDRLTIDTKLLDSFYTAVGTDLASVTTIAGGVMTAAPTPLTGHVSDIDNSSAVYYYDGDLTINTGVTLTIEENVQLRIKGVLQVNGTIDGTGNGATGGAATTQFVGGGTSDTFAMIDYGSGIDLIKDIDYDEGEQGYFGTTIPAASLFVGGSGAALALGDSIGISASWVLGFWGMPGEKVISEGTVSEVPYFNLVNDQQTNTITGYPADLRGNSGTGGIPLTKIGAFGYQGTKYILASGGAGGNGGAGLLIVSRGMAFGGSGTVNLSGGDSSAGVYASYLTQNLYAGSGAPGAPGAMIILLDGQVTNPDITEFKYIANYGSVGYAGGTTLLERYTNPAEVPPTDAVFLSAPGVFPVSYTLGGTGTPSHPWPYTSATYEGPDEMATQDISAYGSAHRLQYIPVDETPSLESERVPPPTLHEKYFVQSAFVQPGNTPLVNDQFGTTVSVSNDRNYLVMGGNGRGTNGAIQIFSRNEWTYTFQQEITGPASTVGYVTEIDDDGYNILLPQFGGTSRVYWYNRSGTTWSLNQTLTITGGHDATDHQSFKAAADLSFAIIGNGYYDTPSINCGRAVIIKRDDTASPPVYYEHSTIQHPSPIILAKFGRIVTISGDGKTAACMEEWDRSASTTGHEWHIFDLDDTASPPTWTLAHSFVDYTSYVTNQGAGVLDYDGTTFIYSDIGGNTMHICEKIDGVWGIVSSFTETGTAALHRFASQLDISSDGRTLVAMHSQSNDPADVEIGSVVVFRKPEQVWIRDQEIFCNDNDIANDGTLGLQAMTMNSNGTMIVVDRTGYDGAAVNTGGVYCFESKLSR